MRTPSSSSVRFSVGAKILCRSGPEEPWGAGTVIGVNYRDPKWPSGKTAPYQVLLDNGSLSFVPQDVQTLCKRLVVPWWAPILDKPDGYFSRNIETAALEQACKEKDVNQCDHRGRTALLEAVRLNWLAGVEALIKMGGDVNIVDEKKVGALHLGYMYGLPMIGLLLKARADPNCKDINPEVVSNLKSATFGGRPEQRTPLHYCCSEGHLESVKLLVQGHANLNVQDGQLKAPLHLAIEEEHDAIVDFLLQSRAAVDFTIESSMKNSPLMLAAYKGNDVLVDKLIRAGADVNKVGKQDMTALHLAARRGDTKIVQILLDANADATIDSEIGSALDLARKNGPAELLQLLED